MEYLTSSIAVMAESVNAIPTISDILYHKAITPQIEMYAITWHNEEAKFNLNIMSSLNFPSFSKRNV